MSIKTVWFWLISSAFFRSATFLLQKNEIVIGNSVTDNTPDQNGIKIM